MRRALATLLAFGALAAPASAHVTVIPSAARPGQTVTLTFRVLNERDDAKTVGIAIFVPAGVHAVASDRPGWTRAGKPGEFDWTTTGTPIAGTSAKDFEIRVGPLPKRDRLVFKALQTYSDGQIVRWIQEPDPNSERPAPVLELTATGKPAAKGGSSAAGFAVLAVVLIAAAGAAAAPSGYSSSRTAFAMSVLSVNRPSMPRSKNCLISANRLPAWFGSASERSSSGRNWFSTRNV